MPYYWLDVDVKKARIGWWGLVIRPFANRVIYKRFWRPTEFLAASAAQRYKYDYYNWPY